MSKTVEEPTATNAEELMRRRDDLALLVREDPSRIAELEAAENAVATHRAEEERRAAADRAEVRRTQEQMTKAAEDERRRKERALRTIRRDLGRNASEFEDLLGPFVAAVRKVLVGVDARSDAQVGLGDVPDSRQARWVVASRISAMLRDLMPGDFNGSPDARIRDQRLDVLLGVANPGEKR